MTLTEEWTFDEFIDVLDEIENNAKSGWDMGFVDDLREKFEKYGADMFISERQVEQIHRLLGD